MNKEKAWWDLERSYIEQNYRLTDGETGYALAAFEALHRRVGNGQVAIENYDRIVLQGPDSEFLHTIVRRGSGAGTIVAKPPLYDCLYYKANEFIFKHRNSLAILSLAFACCAIEFFMR